MVEKKATTKTAAKKTATKKATAAKTATATKKTSTAKKEVIYLTAENAGFRAVMFTRHWLQQNSLSLWRRLLSRQRLVLRMLSLVSDGSSKRVRLRKRTTR